MPLFPNATATRYRNAAQVIGMDRRPIKSQATASLSVHHEPMGNEEREVLPEGLRTRDPRVVFAAPDSFRSADVAGEYDADEVSIPDFGMYQVVGVQRFRDGLIPHDRVTVVKVQEIVPPEGTPWPPPDEP